MHPTKPTLMQHFSDAALKNGSPEIRAYYHQLFRVVDLPHWMREAGFEAVRQNPTYMLRQYPLSTVGRAFSADFLKFCASIAPTLGLPEDELEIWKQLADVDSPKHVFNDPDYQYRCVQTVIVGTVSG